MKTIYYYILMAFFLLTACQEEYEVEGTATQSLAGEWYVDIYNKDKQLIDWGYSLSTFNTAANVPTEMWLKGLAYFNDIQVKVASNPSNGAFGSDQVLTNILDSGGDFVIQKGKVMAGAATAPGGTKTDSICFELTDKSDGSVYFISGYKSTGWPEDNP